MKKNLKRKDPLKKVIVCTVLLVLLTVAAVAGSQMLRNYRADLLAQEQKKVAEANQQKKAEYELAVQQYEAQNVKDQVNTAWPEAASEGWDVVDLTNYPLENPGSVTVTRADVMNNGLLLVNEWHSRPEDFDESAVISLSGYARDSGLDSFWSNSSCKLFPQAIDALIAALKDAKAVGLEHYVVNYSYRTYAEQENLFNTEMAKHTERYSGDALIARTKRSVNYPGTSEFNSGLSFTLYLYESGNATLSDTPFYQTEQGKWFYENSWKYGLVFRFPKANYPYETTTDKSYKTGMNQALNCYRYVGKAHAAVMTHLDLCLEEYIEYLQEHPHIAVFENGVLKYEIVRQQVGDDVASFSVDTTRKTSNYTMSLDNMGGVVTVFEY
ncbi:MAG: D-alanyl-D-alanine carboxypeptidase family protein [Clostridia bacterium]|nr:D-alanyl-D-alanine carboxypeptidase family protein [Clostridia bacterium]